MERIQDMFAAREILLITQDTLKKGSWRYISRKRRYKRGRREKIRRAMGKKKWKFARTQTIRLYSWIALHSQSPFVCRIFKSTTHISSILPFPSTSIVPSAPPSLCTNVHAHVSVYTYTYIFATL